MKLKDSVAVITGGNSGIGLAIAKKFRQHGARIVIFGRNPTTLERAVQEIGEEVLPVQGDVRRLEDLDHLYQQTVEHLGTIDVLVANAGIAKFALLENSTEALFDEVCDVNFKGAFFTVQKALPHLHDGASVILISASGTQGGDPLTSIYQATKAAVRSLARTLSAELVSRQIRVNVLSPGLTQTPILSRDIGIAEEVRDQIATAYIERIPLKRLGRPEEMAKAALFLASSDSAYMVGGEIVLDGGLHQL